MREVVFVAAARTAFGKPGGGFKHVAASDLAALAIKGLMEKSDLLKRGGTVDSVMGGSAFRDSKGLAPMRYSMLSAGLPVETEAHFVEMQDGSAIAAINQAACQITFGHADVVVAGGFESRSTMPVFYPSWNAPYTMAPFAPLPYRYAPTAEEDLRLPEINEKLARTYGITREACDEYAHRSYKCLETAYRTGLTGEEIVRCSALTRDEVLNPTVSMEHLTGMAPTLADGYVTTAGNTGVEGDGAAFLLMMSGEKARELGFEPYARWVVGADIGVQPSLMGIGAAYSNLKALKLAGLDLADMDVLECTEVFAAQNLCVISELEQQSGQKIDMKKWNPNGGAIAIGRPNGASGAREAWFAMKELEKSGGKYGLFSSSCGGGQGVTTIIENLRR